MALLGAQASEEVIDLLNYSDPVTGGSVTEALEFLVPICVSNGTLWPFPMTNNTDETIAGVLPECRLIFHRASLPDAYGSDPARRERYQRVSRASGDRSTSPRDSNSR